MQRTPSQWRNTGCSHWGKTRHPLDANQQSAPSSLSSLNPAELKPRGGKDSQISHSFFILGGIKVLKQSHFGKEGIWREKQLGCLFILLYI